MGRRSHHHRGRHAPRPGRAPLPPSAAAPTLPPAQLDPPSAARPVDPSSRAIAPTAQPAAPEVAPPPPAPAPVAPTSAQTPAHSADESAGDTAAANGFTSSQLRRFIKSRAYIPMHELRRRFGINGAEDEVTAVDVGGSRVFVGLPAREGHLLGDLLRQGDVGYELSVDPVTPIVVGVYPMRPVPRH